MIYLQVLIEGSSLNYSVTWTQKGLNRALQNSCWKWTNIWTKFTQLMEINKLHIVLYTRKCDKININSDITSNVKCKMEFILLLFNYLFSSWSHLNYHWLFLPQKPFIAEYIRLQSHIRKSREKPITRNYMNFQSLNNL